MVRSGKSAFITRKKLLGTGTYGTGKTSFSAVPWGGLEVGTPMHGNTLFVKFSFYLERDWWGHSVLCKGKDYRA